MLRIVAALVLLSLVQTSARAELLLNFGQNGNIGLTNLTVTPGQQITLDVYLTQSGLYDAAPGFGFFVGDYRLSNNPSGNDANGLSSFVLDLVFNNAASVPAANAFTLGTEWVPDPTLLPPLANVIRVGGFGDDGGAQLVPVPKFVSQPFATLPNIPNNNPAANNSLLLGSLVLDTDPLGFSPFTIQLVNPFDPDPTSPDNLSIFDLGSNFGTFAVPTSTTLTITAVPEPTSMLSLAAACGVFGLAKRFRILRERKL